jgi:hypothetical protein
VPISRMKASSGPKCFSAFRLEVRPGSHSHLGSRVEAKLEGGVGQSRIVNGGVPKRYIDISRASKVAT